MWMTTAGARRQMIRSMTAIAGTVGRRNRATSAEIAAACVSYAVCVRYQSVSIDALCAASGASERRVRDAFYDCYRMSPTAYLRAAALREVRRVLLAKPDARDAVTRAASDLGFWHLSRFAGQYRALFGESPRETVNRARADERPHDSVVTAVASL
jgi:AraC family transcriptional regulator, ethanolamine operon transcriptional activator